MSPIDRRRFIATSAAALASVVQPAYAQSGAGHGPELRFLVLGDWGRRGDRVQKAVARQMERHAGDFVVTVGDNFYNWGVDGADDAQWQQSFDGVYDREKLKLWYPALGNHDYYSGRPDAQVRRRDVDKDWDMPGRHYVREVTTPAGRKVRLIILDTSPLADPSRFAPSRAAVTAQWEWLDRELAAPADWKIVFGHHFIHSSGVSGRDYPLLRDGLAPRLRNQGVQAYVAGHDHHLEYLRDTHAQPGRESVAYILSGAGSRNDGMRPQTAPGHVSGWDEPGFTAFSIQGEQLSVEFVGTSEEPLKRIVIPRGGRAA